MSKKNVTGKVVKAGSYKLPEPKQFTWDGKTITNTHRLSIELEGEGWFSIGETDKEDFIVKDDNGNWKILGAGSEVLIKYTETTGKNGKVYKNAKKGDITVLNLVEGKKYEPNQNQGGGSSSGGSSSGYKKDYTGVEVGHALNGAGFYLKHKFDEQEKVVKVAQMVHTITASVKASYKEANPDMSEYDAGAAVGHAVLNACKASGASKKNFTEEELRDTTFKVLAAASEIREFIKPTPKQEPEPQTPAAPQEPQSFDDFDDSIPF